MNKNITFILMLEQLKESRMTLRNTILITLIIEHTSLFKSVDCYVIFCVCIKMKLVLHVLNLHVQTVHVQFGAWTCTFKDCKLTTLECIVQTQIS